MIDPKSINIYSLPSVELKHRSQLPKARGVYFAIDSANKIQYIGSACGAFGLRGRWQSEIHHRHKDVASIEGVRIAYLEIGDTALAREIEELLTEWFKPPLNKRFKSKTLKNISPATGLAKILQERLKQLGWSRYRLTQEYCRVRGEDTDPGTIKKFETTVKRALENPNKSSTEVIEALVKALDGEQYIRWNTRKEVITGHEDIKVS